MTMHPGTARPNDDALLLKARRMALRTRAAAACMPCKANKARCSDYRPCARCKKAGAESYCIDLQSEARPCQSDVADASHHKSVGTIYADSISTVRNRNSMQCAPGWTAPMPYPDASKGDIPSSEYASAALSANHMDHYDAVQGIPAHRVQNDLSDGQSMSVRAWNYSQGIEYSGASGDIGGVQLENGGRAAFWWEDGGGERRSPSDLNGRRAPCQGEQVCQPSASTCRLIHAQRP
jgi:hypothetical protein